MIDSCEIDSSHLIGKGISLLHELVDAPQQMLHRAFNDDFLRNNLLLHHIGLMVSPCNHTEMLAAIKAKGLKVRSEFPSILVAAQLSNRFGKKVKVDIYSTCLLYNYVQTLELFRVVEGLEAHEVFTVMSDIMHIAYTPTKLIDVETLCEKMSTDGFEYVGGGIIYSIDTVQTNSSTILYFINQQLLKNIPKIEFVLPGIHMIPSIQKHAVLFRTNIQQGVGL